MTNLQEYVYQTPEYIMNNGISKDGYETILSFNVWKETENTSNATGTELLSIYLEYIDKIDIANHQVWLDYINTEFEFINIASTYFK